MNNNYFKPVLKTREDLLLEEELLTTIFSDEEFMSEIVTPLSVGKEKIAENLFAFLDCQKEFHNCKNCKGLKMCQNPNTGMFIHLESRKNNIVKNYSVCKYLEKEKKLFKMYTQAEFSDKFDGIMLKDLKHYKNGNRQQLKIAMINKLKDNDASWLYVYGEKESSKSEFLVAYANEFISLNKGEVAFIDTKNSLEFVKNNIYKNENDVKEYLMHLIEVDLLVLDNFTSEVIINNVIRDQFILPLIKARYDHKKETCIASNLNLEEMTNFLAINSYGIKNALEITRAIHQKLYKKTYYLEHLII